MTPGYLSVMASLPAVLAMYLPFCAAEIKPTLTPLDAPPATLWAGASNVTEQDLYNGPWGVDLSPAASDRYVLIQRKHTGINPGLSVRDSIGRQWNVKQAASNDWNEGPVEVVVSRVLSAVGYHQPPIYYLPSFTLVDDWGSHVEPGGRFRLSHRDLKDHGEWSWQQNPFVGTTPYQGLLVILMMFNSSDLKNSNNTVYEYRGANGREHRYVVRDLGTALGSTGRLVPEKGRPDVFARLGFIREVRDGFAEFEYYGWHQELVRRRITPADVRWASDLLAQLTDRQWADAFRAGGYSPEVAMQFIGAIRRKIAQGQQLSSASGRLGGDGGTPHSDGHPR